ncbi:MAG: amino acid ABC transporter permease [Phototrophicaceae bacterium]
MTDASQDHDLTDVKSKARERVVFTNAYTAPYWLIIMILGWFYIIYQMSINEDYSAAYEQIKGGVPLTIWLALASYILALIIGLVTGIIRAFPPEPPETKLPPKLLARRIGHVGVYHIVSVYIEFMRGIPPLVFLLIAGFIVVPIIRDPIIAALDVTYVPFYNTLIQPLLNGIFNQDIQGFDWLFREYGVIEELRWRGRDPATAIAGLGLIYGAFLSEVFRAGIQAVPRGQFEAAQSVGMTYYQTLRFIVIPQAIRNVLPPLGNNFISMIKDTSLVTILGTTDITQIARRWSGSQFTYLETYAVLSMVYLTMTISGSLLIQVMERRLRKFAKK